MRSVYQQIPYAHGGVSSITSVLAATLVPPPKDSVGAKILKKMGWRPGQGIGPRLTYAQKKAQDAGRTDLSKEVEGDEEDIEEAKKHLYPRKDIPVVVYPRKDNFHGLGYTPGLSLHESVGGGERGRGGPNISGMDTLTLVPVFRSRLTLPRA